ncbi:MAG: toll/interleukin-1 receptor domain-containing protein [Cyanobacteria bacterium P01_F01_bin.53]
MSRIFISYRRSDAAAEAGRIYDYLERAFGHEAIFKDVDAIDAGDDFRDRINDAVGQCQVLLAVIGKSWLQVTDEAGQRRLDNPADLVRLEIETALLRKVRVIPLLLDGVAMPTVRDLPTALVPLVDRNAARVRHDPDFRRDMDRVIEVIQRELEGCPQTVEQLKGPFSNTPPTVLPSKSPPSERSPLREKRLSVISKAVPRNDANHISRRRLFQLLAYSGAGLGAAFLGRDLFQGGEDWQLPTLEAATINGTTAEFNVATVNVSKKSIAIVRD